MEINVSLKEKDKTISLKIGDNGSGFKIGDLENTSFGLALIHDLSVQLNAKLNFSSDTSGTNYELVLNS